MADTILTSDKLSHISPLNPPSRIVCHVCQKQFSQYTCPRCNSRYCSLPCYKTHSLRCTESFMRENVLEELQQMQPEDETKQRMLEILKRFHSEEETDTMDEDDSFLSEDTVQKVLSGNEVCFEELSAAEKRRFRRAVASGELGKLIEPWEPWWLKPSARKIILSKEGTQLVQPISGQEALSSNHGDVSDQYNEFPPGPATPLCPVRKLASAEPSPLLAVHLVDIIYSYCFTLRLYNGDWKSDAEGSVTVVLSISSVLGQASQPETVLEALSHSLEQTCSPEFKNMGGLQFGLLVIDDVINLLHLGGPALICSLCDLQRLVQAGEKELKVEKPKSSRRSERRYKLKLAEKKVYFIMCWVHEQPAEVWASLASLLESEKRSFTDYIVSKSTGNTGSKVEGKGKVVIEELK